MFPTRFVSRVGVPLALVGLIGVSTHATSQAASDHAVSVAEAPQPEPSSNMIVVKDAQTGELRMPTVEEMNALQAPAAAAARSRGGLQMQSRAAEQPLQKYHVSGARGARLTSDFVSFTVAIRQADGSYAMQCFDSREQAEAAMRASASSRQVPHATTE